MPREKIRRTEERPNVDMIIVKQLTDLRDSINQKAKDTGMFCNLFPDINKKVCQECPGKKRDENKCELCFEREAEREFIHKKEATKGNQRRERKQDNPKHNILEISVKTSDDEEYDEMYEKYDVDEETPEIIEVDSEDDKYPCHAMNFTCPNRIECDFGKKCKYK